jgi:hypothetical protein
LCLGGWSDFAFNGQIGQEGGDFGRAEFGGVAAIVEENETLDPIDVTGFGAGRIVTDSDFAADSVEEAGLVWGGGGGIGCGRTW